MTKMAVQVNSMANQGLVLHADLKYKEPSPASVAFQHDDRSWVDELNARIEIQNADFPGVLFWLNILLKREKRSI
jgi:hypothetical protein